MRIFIQMKGVELGKFIAINFDRLKEAVYASKK